MGKQTWKWVLVKWSRLFGKAPFRTFCLVSVLPLFGTPRPPRPTLEICIFVTVVQMPQSAPKSRKEPHNSPVVPVAATKQLCVDSTS